MSNDVYKEFLEYLLFSEEEIEKELDDFKFACEKADITAEDVAFAKDVWIPENWCAKYKGVRMALGVIVREFIDVCLTPKFRAEGKKLVYGILPAYSNLYYALQYADPDVLHLLPGHPPHHGAQRHIPQGRPHVCQGRECHHPGLPPLPP